MLAGSREKELRRRKGTARGPRCHLINKYSLGDCCVPRDHCDENGDAPGLPGGPAGRRG